MKGKKKNQTIDAKLARNSISRNSVVDAVVIHAPDFSLNLKLQNLLNFFIEGLKSFNLKNVFSGEIPKDLKLCIGHLKTVNSEGNLVNGEVEKLLNELIEEIGKFTNLLSVFSKTGSHNSIDPVEIVLSAKLSRLQWLSVCVLEELKRSFNNK
jgi:hypothetical protein